MVSRRQVLQTVPGWPWHASRSGLSQRFPSCRGASYDVDDTAVQPEGGTDGELHEPEDEDNAEAALVSARATMEQGERALHAILQSLELLDKDNRREEVARACLEVRDLCSSVVVTMLECAQWAAVADDQSTYVRFHVSATRPIVVMTSKTLLPALSGFYMKRFPLHVACSAGSALGCAAGIAAFYGVPRWWLAVLVIASWPSVVFLVACLNRKLLRNLGTSFQPLFVCCVNCVAVGSFCALWRHQPAKVVALLAMLPSMLLAGWTDALPEVFRVPVSRVFFSLNTLGFLILLAGIAFNRLGFDDVEVDLLGLRTVKISSLAASALTSLLPFAVRNLGVTFLQPGVLAIIQSSTASVKLSARALLVAKATHVLAVLQVSNSNKEMAKAHRSLSKKSLKAVSAHFRADNELSIQVTELDESELPAASAACATARVAAFDMPIPSFSEDSPETTLEKIVTILRACVKEFDSVKTILLSIPGAECWKFHPVVSLIRRCGDSSAKLAAVGMDMFSLTTFAVGPADLCRCLVSSRQPAAVRTANSLIPAVSRVYLKFPLLRAASNVLWTFSGVAVFLVVYDVRPDYQWCFTAFATLSLPGVCLISSCLNRKILSKLFTKFRASSSPPFQPFYVLFWILVMYCCLVALWRSHPAKSVAFGFVLPQCVLASFLDAYPEAGRRKTSRCN